MYSGGVYALLAAGLFRASTPFAKTLLGQIAPVTLAGLLYLGSGLGLLAWSVLRAMQSNHRQTGTAHLRAPDVPWLAGAIAAGGIAGPVQLMLGLTLTPA